jgi:hypothetical protein
MTDGDLSIAVDGRILDPEKDGKSQNEQGWRRLDRVVLNRMVDFGIDVTSA